MKVKRVVRPKAPVDTTANEVAIRVLAGLAFIFVMLLPLTLTAIGPLTVRVVSSTGETVPRACVTESWPAYTVRDIRGANVDTVNGVAYALARADTSGVVQLPSRAATASGFRRLSDVIANLITRMFGGRPTPPVVITVLGPGYRGATTDLKPQSGVVIVVARADVQSVALRNRFARSCVP